MEHFFYQGEPGEDPSTWFGETPARLSDFVPYVELQWANVDQSEHKNVKMRVVEMARRSWRKTMQPNVRRMLKERLRRQSLKEGYTRLRAILPIGTKNDKISITTAAAEEIMRMRRALESLQRRNRELNERMATMGEGEVGQGVSKVSLKVEVPVSGIDSMAEVLHCAKDMGSGIRRIKSHFSDQELSVEIEMDSQADAHFFN